MSHDLSETSICKFHTIQSRVMFYRQSADSTSCYSKDVETYQRLPRNAKKPSGLNPWAWMMLQLWRVSKRITASFPIDYSILTLPL